MAGRRVICIVGCLDQPIPTLGFEEYHLLFNTKSPTSRFCTLGVLSQSSFILCPLRSEFLQIMTPPHRIVITEINHMPWFASLSISHLANHKWHSHSQQKNH
jgi:hypothetical protein